MWMQRWGLLAVAVMWLVGIALASMLPISGAGWPLLMGGLLTLVAAIIVTTLTARRLTPATWNIPVTALWLLAALLLALARFAGAAPSNDPLNVVHLGFGNKIYLQGSVGGEPDVRNKGAFIIVNVTEFAFTSSNPYDWHPVHGTVQVFALGAQSEFAPEYGDTVEFIPILSAPTHAAPGIDADAGAQQVTILARGGGNPILGAIYALRERLARVLESSLPAPEAALIIGILLGLKTPTLRARLPLFVRTGTIHLVVTSGLKVTMVGDIMARLARPLGRFLGVGLAFGSVIGYVLLSGAGPAAIRAGIMAVVLIGARFLGRDYDVLRALALATFLMTLVTPTILWDAGFQLSAAGTLGIAILGPRFRVPLVRWWGGRRIGHVAADVLASTLAAQLATLPIVAITFGIVSFVSLLTNLLLVPFLPLFLLLGTLVGMGGLFVAQVGIVLGLFAWPFLRLADIVIEGTAALPWAAATVGAIPGWIIPLWMILIGGVPLFWHAPGRAAPPSHRPAWPRPLRFALAMMVALSLFIGAVATTAVASAPLTVTFLDVGTGGPATLLRLSNGRTVLIDGGADGPSLLNALATTLPFWQHRIDLLVVTEMRPGHYAALQSVITAYQVGQVADPGVLHPTNNDVAWYVNLQAAHIPLTHLLRGSSIALAPDAQLEVLNPPHPLFATADELDANALIVRLVTPGLRILFAGDANDHALAAASTIPVDALRADIVQFCQLPNEALLTGTGQADLLRLALPRLIVIAPSARTAPKPGTLNALPSPDDPAAMPGMVAVRTAAAGTLTLTSDGNGWGLST